MAKLGLSQAIFLNWVVSLVWAAGLYLARVVLLHFGWSKWIGVLTLIQFLTWLVVASWTVALVVCGLAKRNSFENKEAK